MLSLIFLGCVHLAMQRLGAFQHLCINGECNALDIGASLVGGELLQRSTIHWIFTIPPSYKTRFPTKLLQYFSPPLHHLNYSLIKLLFIKKKGFLIGRTPLLIAIYVYLVGAEYLVSILLTIS